MMWKSILKLFTNFNLISLMRPKYNEKKTTYRNRWILQHNEFTNVYIVTINETSQ